jgi:hypothetical protein
VESGVLEVESGVLGVESGVLEVESGVLEVESGVMSGVRSNEECSQGFYEVSFTKNTKNLPLNESTTL